MSNYRSNKLSVSTLFFYIVPGVSVLLIESSDFWLWLVLNGRLNFLEDLWREQLYCTNSPDVFVYLLRLGRTNNGGRDVRAANSLVLRLGCLNRVSILFENPCEGKLCLRNAELLRNRLHALVSLQVPVDLNHGNRSVTYLKGFRLGDVILELGSFELLCCGDGKGILVRSEPRVFGEGEVIVLARQDTHLERREDGGAITKFLEEWEVLLFNTLAGEKVVLRLLNLKNY